MRHLRVREGLCRPGRWQAAQRHLLAPLCGLHEACGSPCVVAPSRASGLGPVPKCHGRTTV